MYLRSCLIIFVKEIIFVSDEITYVTFGAKRSRSQGQSKAHFAIRVVLIVEFLMLVVRHRAAIKATVLFPDFLFPLMSTCINIVLVGSCYSIFSFMCMLCRSLFVPLSFSVCLFHYVVYPSSIYCFCIPSWHLQTLHLAKI